MPTTPTTPMTPTTLLPVTTIWTSIRMWLTTRKALTNRPQGLRHCSVPLGVAWWRPLSSCWSCWVLVSDFKRSAMIISRTKIKTWDSWFYFSAWFVGTCLTFVLCILQESWQTWIWSWWRRCGHSDSRETLPWQTQCPTLPQNRKVSYPIIHHLSSIDHHPSSWFMCVTVERVWRLISNFVLLICVHAGARVLHSLSSDTYWHRNPHSWRVIDKIYHWYYSPLSQRRVIQVRIHNHKFS